MLFSVVFVLAEEGPWAEIYRQITL